MLRRNRQLSSPLLSTRNTVTFSTLLLIAFLLSYLCTSFNLPNIFRLSCCPCPSPKPPRALFSLILSFLLVFLRSTTKTKGENTYIYTHTYIFSVVPPRRNLKLMVNYIRPATEPRTWRGREGGSFLVLRHAPPRGWSPRTREEETSSERVRLMPSRVYCYRYAEPSPSWRWKRGTRR